MRIGRSFAVLALAAITFAACGGDDDTKTVNTGDGSVTVDKDGDDTKISVDSDKGSAEFGTGTDVPDDFPTDDVPLPEDLELQSAISSKQGSEFSLSYKVDEDDAKSAVSDYEDALTDAGFTIDDDASASIGGSEIINLRASGNGWTVATSGMTGGVNLLVITVTEGTS